MSPRTQPRAHEVHVSRRVERERAGRLLSRAATLDLERERLLVRCLVGRYADWWDLDEALQLLQLADELCEVERPDRTELAVTEGIDLYLFNVT